LKYRVKAEAGTLAPEAALRVAKSTHYEEESLRESVKLSLNSRRILARFRPPRRLHNSCIYVQCSPIKNKNVGRRAFCWYFYELIMTKPQHGEISNLHRSLSTLVRTFYTVQIRIDDGGSADDINISLHFLKGEKDEGRTVRDS